MFTNIICFFIEFSYPFTLFQIKKCFIKGPLVRIISSDSEVYNLSLLIKTNQSSYIMMEKNGVYSIYKVRVIYFLLISDAKLVKLDIDLSQSAKYRAHSGRVLAWLSEVFYILKQLRIYRKRGKESKMEIWMYNVEKIDGDYAYLKRTDITINELKLVARAIMPPEITEGTQLKYELFEYTIIE
jgi:hypothetical protein